MPLFPLSPLKEPEDNSKQNFAKKKRDLEKKISRKIDRLKKSERKAAESLKECEKWAVFQHEADLIKAHFNSIKKGDRQVRVLDWMEGVERSVALDPLKTPQKNMADLYQKAKKLQRGKQPLLLYLHKLQTHFSHLKFIQAALLLAETDADLDALALDPFHIVKKEQKANTAKKEKKPYHAYLSSTGMRIWAGKNAKGNDQLTFKLANGNDWWFHVSGFAGSHVIVKLDGKNDLDSQTLEEALQLALYHSQGRKCGEAEVVFTQRKNVSSINKGKPGAVQISNRQIARVRLDEKGIKSRAAPEL